MTGRYSVTGTAKVVNAAGTKQVLDAFAALAPGSINYREAAGDELDITLNVDGDFARETIVRLETILAQLRDYVLEPAVLRVRRNDMTHWIVIDLRAYEATLVLYDLAEGAADVSLGVVVSNEGGILEIRPNGYGEADAEDGHGAPVFLEFYKGRLRVVISPDILTQDKQIIDLEKARESRRPPEE